MENDARKYCTRLGQLKAARAQYESHWAECYRFGAPERQQSFAGSDVKNQRETERADLYDSTAADSVQVLVSMIMNGVTPANAIWFKAQPDGIDDLSEVTEGERWLEDVCQFMWRNIHGANFDSENFDTITDVVTAGWGVMYVDIDREAGGGYVFESWPTGSCFIGSSRADGLIDTIYREHEMTAEAMINTYGVIHRAKPCVKAVQVSDHRFSQEKSMGSYYNESYAEFLDSLKAAGVVIRNESEVRERLAESQRWRTAFMTLAANGRTLGIEFSVAGKSSDPRAVQRVLAEHAFPAEKEAAFIAQLTADR